MRSKSVEQIGLGFDLTVANGIQPEQCFFPALSPRQTLETAPADRIPGNCSVVEELQSLLFSIYGSARNGGSWEAEKDQGALHTSRLFPFVSFPVFFHPRD